MPASIVADLLPRDERELFAKCGGAVSASGFGKSALDFSSLFDVGTKGILYGSILGGIPIGIVAHLVHKKIQDRRLKERELDKQIEYYRNAASGIEHGLAGMGVER